MIDWLPFGLIYSHAAVQHGPRCIRCGRWVSEHAGPFRRWLWRKTRGL
jgi:hypothetical protein